ncbi:energy-coupling factor ABC transporter ATP-binding protein [Paenibacillus sp. UNC499MF]|uniref:energy-coupling factor ABC transporter ATP-binding protein n=1 Tax=Paenibacillus sp. UNC499MF TaxID=1502751 RepID=UPI0008A05CCD|nr:ATP-binding cassette domain-containing protein [Paenibacillus sp. UNC499MF]SEG14869.1 energy-coupling factor transport system ATP-binding protein [Paenibacillus sp. UNC499MF]
MNRFVNRLEVFAREMENDHEKHTQSPYRMHEVSVLKRGEPAEGVSAGDQTLLNEINIELHKGEWLAIVGPNGSGKSTLAKVMAGLIPAAGGSIEPGWAAGERMRMVLQNPDTQLIGETVYEDLCFGMENAGLHPERMPGTALHVLDLVGLADKRNDSCEVLSGGQKQLTAVAGALAVGASVLVMDEVTSMLDSSSRRMVIDALSQLHEQGITVVWITQRLDELAHADKVIVLDEGKTVYSGDPIDFFYGSMPDEGYRGTGIESSPSPSPCLEHGYELPYTVEVTRELHRLGALGPEERPVTPSELMEVLKRYGL